MQFLISVLFLLSTVSQAKERLILWDVGQGQWATFTNDQSCHHFDMGGERFPYKVLSECGQKENRLSITHWDFDHISFVFKALRYGLLFCIWSLPDEDHKWKKALQEQPSCENLKGSSQVKLILPQWSSNKRNDRSVIFKLSSGILITGDAPTKVENDLYRSISSSQVKFLVVGHHGSLTSSSEKFIRRLVNLKMALLSARKQKYNHPHPIVQARFKRNRIPLVSTHDWGHLILSLPSQE